MPGLRLGIAAPADESAAELADDVAAPPVMLDGASEAFGRLVHALLALSPLPDVSASARTLAPQCGLGAAALVVRAAALPEIAAAASADVVHRELPFAVPLGGVLTTGRIDLAYRKDGAWTVVDFKTSAFADSARALEAYGAQVATHRDALRAITGEPVQAAFFLLISGGLVTLD